MQTRWIMAVLAAALLAWNTPAQESGNGALRPLSPLNPQPSFLGAPSPSQAFDGDLWRERLTDQDLDRREAAFDEWARELGDHPGARDQLAEWALQADELAWTARLLQRELRAPKNPIDQMRAEIDNLHGGLFQGGLGAGLFGQGSPFDAWVPGGPLDALMKAPGLSQSSQSSFSITQTPEGIRVEVSDTENGETQTKVYEATDREELLRLHPELKQHLERGTSSLPLPGRDLSPGFGDWRGPGLRPLQRPVPKDRLGVYVEAESEANANLSVRSVVPGSLAETLGVQAEDELIELNGRRLQRVEDIAAVLRERKAGEALELTVIRSNGELRELIHTPE